MSVNSQSIVLQTNTSAKDKLAQEWGWVLENQSKKTLAGLLKKAELSGDIATGTMNAKRFANAEAKDYGTARTAGAAEKIKALNVAIPIDDHKEWLEEVEELDIRTYGVDGIIEKRTQNQSSSINRYFDRRFFYKGFLAGSIETLTETDTEKMAEELIQKLQSLENDFVDGVDREKMALILNVSTYGKLREKIDSFQNANVDTAVGEFGMFHGVMVYSSHRLPDTVDMMIMVAGESIAQPIGPRIYAPQAIEFSKATAFGAFTDSSTTVVASDLIKIVGTIGAVVATSADAGEANKTDITVTSTKSSPANEFWYKAHATEVAAPAYGIDADDNDWTKMVLDSDNQQELTLTSEDKIRIAEVDESGRIIKTSAQIDVVKGD